MSLRTCAQKGCPTLVKAGRCAVHAREADRTRGTAQERGYDARWAAYSATYRRQHPVCGEQTDGRLDPTHSRCLQQGRITPAECVDHIIPVSQGGPMWESSNHQSLCTSCNVAKGNR
jgi:5-methylcytosine-specific restriction protein A